MIDETNNNSAVEQADTFEQGKDGASDVFSLITPDLLNSASSYSADVSNSTALKSLKLDDFQLTGGSDTKSNGAVAASPEKQSGTEPNIESMKKSHTAKTREVEKELGPAQSSELEKQAKSSPNVLDKLGKSQPNGEAENVNSQSNPSAKAFGPNKEAKSDKNQPNSVTADESPKSEKNGSLQKFLDSLKTGDSVKKNTNGEQLRKELVSPLERNSSAAENRKSFDNAPKARSGAEQMKDILGQMKKTAPALEKTP